MKKFDLNTALGFLQKVHEGNGIAIANGTKARKRVLYVAGLGTKLTNNNGKMLLPVDNKAYGITNFDKGNTLSAGRVFLVTGVRLLFDTTTASVNTLIATWSDEAPVSFKNGELTISQQGTGEILNTPMLPLCRRSSSISVEADFFEVVPFLLRDQSDIDITAIQVGTSAGASVAWRIEFEGVEFTAADKA